MTELAAAAFQWKKDPGKALAIYGRELPADVERCEFRDFDDPEVLAVNISIQNRASEGD